MKIRSATCPSCKIFYIWYAGVHEGKFTLSLKGPSGVLYTTFPAPGFLRVSFITASSFAALASASTAQYVPYTGYSLPRNILTIGGNLGANNGRLRIEHSYSTTSSGTIFYATRTHLFTLGNEVRVTMPEPSGHSQLALVLLPAIVVIRRALRHRGRRAASTRGCQTFWRSPRTGCGDARGTR